MDMQMHIHAFLFEPTSSIRNYQYYPPHPCSNTVFSLGTSITNFIFKGCKLTPNPFNEIIP